MFDCHDGDIVRCAPSQVDPVAIDGWRAGGEAIELVFAMREVFKVALPECAALVSIDCQQVPLTACFIATCD